MNDTITLSYQLYTDVINLLDKVAHLLDVDLKHQYIPSLLYFQPYARVENNYKVMRDLEFESAKNQCFEMITELFDETADQIQYIALPTAFEE